VTRQQQTTLILGGTGKTGRRVAERLSSRGLPVRIASRSGQASFDWNDERTWGPVLKDVGAAYLTYFPDLAVPGAAEHIRKLARRAVDSGVRKLVLLAGRGEPQVLPAEEGVRKSGAAFTILRCAFFCQNFNEGALTPAGDEIVFPAGEVAEPFIDCDDIADVAVAALTDDRHAGQIYELTGPALVTFAQAAEQIAAASARPIRYVPVTFEQYAEALAPILPGEHVAFLVELFRGLLDGHNAHLTDGVQRAIGRKPRDFRAFARDAAARGAWTRAER